MPGSMLILTWVDIIFVIILHRAIARCNILTNIMPTSDAGLYAYFNMGRLYICQDFTPRFAFARCKILTNIMPTHA
jgi:hypothetical protein